MSAHIPDAQVQAVRVSVLDEAQRALDRLGAQLTIAESALRHARDDLDMSRDVLATLRARLTEHQR